MGQLLYALFVDMIYARIERRKLYIDRRERHQLTAAAKWKWATGLPKECFGCKKPIPYLKAFNHITFPMCSSVIYCDDCVYKTFEHEYCFFGGATPKKVRYVNQKDNWVKEKV
jgi:hypothetical protein